jgi:AraC-like DNA-binding protein
MISVSTDAIRPAERQAFWTEAICRSFANVAVRPLGAAAVRGHFEFVEAGSSRLARFDTSPQCYSRDARLVSSAGADEFMFDIQLRGRTRITQGRNDGVIGPGFGVLYDARRPFEDRLDAADGLAEVLIVTVPAPSLSGMVRDVDALCATPIPLRCALAHAVIALVRGAIRSSRQQPDAPVDVTACLAALLHVAQGRPHRLSRPDLFTLIDVHLQRDLAAAATPPVIAAQFGISERSLHRIFAAHDTTFERHLLRRRVEHLRDALRRTDIPIGRLAHVCGFADAAHAARSFRRAFGVTPRDYRAAAG